MLEAVKIRDAERVYAQYPHEISGGMGQRVLIAMMLLADPDLVIADEPTSALDVTVRLQVLNILDGLVRDRGIGLIMISHDLNLVRNFCDRVLIMYAGRVVETLKASELDSAQHPYTQGLLPRSPASEAPAHRLPFSIANPNGWRRKPDVRIRRSSRSFHHFGEGATAVKVLRAFHSRYSRANALGLWASQGPASRRFCAACRC